MFQTMTIALRFCLVTLVLTGLAYPALVTGFAQLLFPWRASGSPVKDERGAVVGSELLAQRFLSPAYFQPRPSAAGDGYDTNSSGGSNFGPTSAKLRNRVKADIARLQKENPAAAAPVPLELVSASGSGLDPHLTPTAALWQVGRIAAARKVSPERVRALVADREETPVPGIGGERRVNVLLLDLDLDRSFGRPALPVPAGAPPGGK
ncbi:MAG: potassium-transporting ATPase subunit KdpC [Candidatus Wallbacteria bacterium]|nr:potassium-transporting ATPase subunit KdpC [Candidatus Wallbacteria bacterium]